jgi:hypothetical protein
LAPVRGSAPESGRKSRIMVQVDVIVTVCPTVMVRIGLLSSQPLEIRQQVGLEGNDNQESGFTGVIR